MNQAHLHLLLNHIPILGVAFGCLFFVYALWRKNLEVTKASLGFLGLVGVLAVPAYLTGEPAEKVIEHLPGVSEALIESHESAALLALSLTIAVGIVAIVGLFLIKKNNQLPVWYLLATLFLLLASVATMMRAGNLGGQIRHTEIRANAVAVGENQQPGNAAEKKKEKDDDDK